MLSLKRRTTVGLMLAGLAMAGLLGQYGDVSAASLTSKVQVTVTAELVNVLDLGSQPTAKLVSAPTVSLGNGTGANQANVVWWDERTLTASTTEDLDFAGGGLVDAFGVAVAPAKLRAVVIQNTSSTQVLTLFGDANSIPILNTAATTYTLQPGGVFVGAWPATAGIAVTAGTGDIIQVANAAGVSATYKIIVLGTTS